MCKTRDLLWQKATLIIVFTTSPAYRWTQRCERREICSAKHIRTYVNFLLYNEIQISYVAYKWHIWHHKPGTGIEMEKDLSKNTMAPD